MNTKAKEINATSGAMVLASRTAVLVVPEPSVYRQLIDKAQELGITNDPSDTSFQSRVFYDLLQNIRALEQLRTNLSWIHQGEPPEQVDTSLPRDFGHLWDSTHQKPTFDPLLDLSNYDDSPEAAFYSRLLNTRLKLHHEVRALEYLRERAQNGPKDRIKPPPPSASDDEEYPRTRVRVREEEMSYRRVPDRVPHGSSYRARERSENSSEIDSQYSDADSRDGLQYDANHEQKYLTYDYDQPPDWLLVYSSTDDSTDHRSHRQDNYSSEIFYAKRHLSEKDYDLDGVFDIDEVLQEHPRIAFVLERRYHCVFSSQGRIKYTEADCTQQSITYLSEPLKRVLEPFKPTPITRVRWDLILFHRRSEVISALPNLPAKIRAQMELLLDATRNDFEEATHLFETEMVTRLHLGKLFSWNAVIVVPGEPVEAYRCGVQPVVLNRTRAIIQIEASRWSFNGKLYLTTSPMTIHASHGPMQIRSLKAYPLQYAKPEIRDMIVKRGQTFWMCRRKAFISYGAPGQVQRSQGPANYRFMIDYDTYRELHPDAEEFADEDFEGSKEIYDEDMDKDNPPGNGLELVFPPYISGYSIQDKKWKTLSVDYIKPVTWNKLAFERLVLKPVAKELIQAVVQVHDSKERSADLMQGKGNGSLILLHGPPGTGKTLTAESVAELVQRPLYRVSCGDVGTDPENVESYLESVLYIGKIWGCVVLLDEADVFLEERTLTDLHRNALVSVFLRVLEYYDGVLILTSNRVGTFDEAFKSRIKLALHYSSLGRADRRKIWRNFFKTLKETDPDNVDFEDLDDHLDDLADVKLNGRDIRNAISVARELAHFRKDEKMNYEHIRHVIGVGEEFEKYLDKTHGHKTDDWLKENGIRA
ncbi:Fc.00g002400.m01.CDS01 [Cosmosporella sp. VM-42]